jgi:hypothetical protein
MTLTTTANMVLSFAQVPTIDLGDGSVRRKVSAAVTLTDGTGAGQADRVFADTRTLGVSATEDLDLSGALTDAFGATQVFARVKAVMFKAAVGNTNNVQVTRPASNGFPLFMAAGDGISLRPGECFGVLCDAADTVGHLVTAATGDLLTITNSGAGTSVSYDIIVIGASA